MKEFFVFRNTTIEPLFSGIDAELSGYGDISVVPDAKRYVWAYLFPMQVREEKIILEINAFLEKLEIVLGRVPKESTFILFTMDLLGYKAWNATDYRVDDAVSLYNHRIRELERESPCLKIFKTSDLFSKHAASEVIDWKYYYISSMVLNPKIAKDFQSLFRKYLNLLSQARKKCLVLDADNTLWGGIIGEDGAQGIKLGGAYPGNCFREFQETIYSMYEQGVILALNSKNNESDIDEIFSSHPELVLKREMFSSIKANWQRKSENIVEIASELGIGLDSMVFLDDNPKERELISRLLPELTVPEFPKEPYLLRSFGNEVYDTYFSLYNTTTEDRSKGRQYAARANREKLRASARSYSDYLASLNIKLIIENANDYNIVRLAQLTQKTNQFNLTTKRYDEVDIRKILKEKGMVFSARVIDKFGDNGVAALILVKKVDASICDIDVMLMSCRVLGNGIEGAFLSTVLNYLKDKGFEKVLSKYIETSKNSQVKSFYEDFGFSLVVESGETLVKEYEIKLAEAFQVSCAYEVEWRYES